MRLVWLFALRPNIPILPCQYQGLWCTGSCRRENNSSCFIYFIGCVRQLDHCFTHTHPKEVGVGRGGYPVRPSVHLPAIPSIRPPVPPPSVSWSGWWLDFFHRISFFGICIIGSTSWTGSNMNIITQNRDVRNTLGIFGILKSVYLVRVVCEEVVEEVKGTHNISPRLCWI